jgi:hypothetical protein
MGRIQCSAEQTPFVVGQYYSQSVLASLSKDHDMIRGSPVSARGVFSDVFVLSPELKHGWNYLYPINQTKGQLCHYYQVFCFKPSASDPDLLTCLACCNSPLFEVGCSKRSKSRIQKKSEPSSQTKRHKAAASVAPQTTAIGSTLFQTKVINARSWQEQARTAEEQVRQQNEEQAKKEATERVREQAKEEAESAAKLAHYWEQFRASRPPQLLDEEHRRDILGMDTALRTTFDRIELERKVMVQFIDTFSLDDDAAVNNNFQIDKLTVRDTSQTTVETQIGTQVDTTAAQIDSRVAMSNGGGKPQSGKSQSPLHTGTQNAEMAEAGVSAVELLEPSTPGNIEPSTPGNIEPSTAPPSEVVTVQHLFDSVYSPSGAYNQIFKQEIQVLVSAD